MVPIVVKTVRREDVAVIEIDHAPVNALSNEVRYRLLDALTAAAGDPGISAIVIRGANGRFIAGADLNEMSEPMVSPSLPQVIAKIDASVKPVVAAIDGPALGGGLEVALACDYRISSERAAFALPETRLGLIPGAGGTQRLPRLVGIAWAEALIATGEMITAAQALKIGLIDEVSDDPLGSALAWTRTPSKRRLSALTMPRASANRHITELSAVRMDKPAVRAAVSLVREAAEITFEQGLSREREIFLRLRDGSQSRALIHLFLAGKVASKLGVANKTKRHIALIAVSGAGKRAVSIANLIRRSGLSASIGDDHLHRADLIIDASHERKAQATAKRLSAHVKPGAIIATTRSRNIDCITEDVGYSQDVIGLNFRISSVGALVEVVPTENTASEIVIAILALFRNTPAQAIVTRQSGLVGERILMACRAEADELHSRGIPRKQVSAAVKSFGRGRSNRPRASPSEVVDPALRQRLLARMAQEGAALLSEGIVDRPSAIDLLLTSGYGFTREEGGPMWLAGITDKDFQRSKAQQSLNGSKCQNEHNIDVRSRDIGSAQNVLGGAGLLHVRAPSSGCLP